MITRLTEYANEKKSCQLIIFAAKRWSENAWKAFSRIMTDGKGQQRQLKSLKDAGGLFISYLTKSYNRWCERKLCKSW